MNYGLTDTSISKSKQLEAAVPPSRISSLSSGEFVGMMADNPDCKIELKAFHAKILNDYHAIEKDVSGYKELPLIRKIDNAIVHYNYLDIKKGVAHIIQTEMEKLLSNPGLMHLIIKKKP